MNETNGTSTTTSLWPLVAVLSEIAARAPAAPLVSEQAGSEPHHTPDPIPAETRGPGSASAVCEVAFTCNDEGDTE
jgi:hypothetical protein